MLTAQQIIREISSIKNIADMKYKSQIIGLFGSFARNENSEDSDIDILVKFKKDATLFDLVRLGDFIEEKLKRKTDIVSENSIKPEIKEYILKELIKI